MNDGILTQEQIDKHFRNMNAKQKIELTDNDRDVIGEAGNIFMSTSATSLSTILNKRVQMTTPVVANTNLDEIHKNMKIPYVVVTIKFEKGLEGSNLLLIKTEDASIIADIMMGGDGTEKHKELNEIELSAVAEAMNQMIGSAATSIATMLNRPIEISSPEIEVWAELADIQKSKYSLEDEFVKIGFKMTIEGLLESNIMQLYSLAAVKDIVDVLTSGLSNTDQSQEIKENIDHNELISNTQTNNPINENEKQALPKNMELLLDVLLDLNVVFGKTKKPIKEILTFGVGTVIELNEAIDEPLEIYVNNKLIAYGEVVAVDERYGVRVTNIVSQQNRVKEIL